MARTNIKSLIWSSELDGTDAKTDNSTNIKTETETETETEAEAKNQDRDRD